MWEKFHDFRGAILWNLTIYFFEGDLDVCFAYSGVVFTKTLVGGILPDGTLFDSGLVFSKTFEGVSFRTGLRG